MRIIVALLHLAGAFIRLHVAFYRITFRSYPSIKSRILGGEAQ